MGAGASALVAALPALPLSTGTARTCRRPGHASRQVHNHRQNPIYANIYYIDHDPAIFSDYSHDPYQFTPQRLSRYRPGQAVGSELDLANPNQWAMVSVSIGGEPSTPNFHCDLAVDGAAVVSNDGPRGALCSLRTW